jgi:putative ABC transport system permease protein
MSAAHTRDPGVGAFRLLLRLYPRSFRNRFEHEMVEFFRARRNEQRHRRGAWGALRLWTHLVTDVVTSAPREYARAAATEATTRSLPFASPDYPPETQPMDTLRQDIRYALRTLARHPAFTAVAALTLALGIGANTAIFSVVDAVLLQPLPWPESDRLVSIFGLRGDERIGVSYLDFTDLRRETKAFAELGVGRGQSVNLTGGEAPDRLYGMFVTAGTLRLLGASVSQGRLLNDAETEVATKEPSVVINDAMWRTRLGSRPDVVGRTLVLNGEPFTVVGIMRPGFVDPFSTPDVWLPIGYFPNRGELAARGRGTVAVYGKLARGVTLASARQEIGSITRRLAEIYPATNARISAGAEPIETSVVGDARTPLYIVLASVAVVLLIACANVANLQLARATARQRELSVRAALGAGRSRLVRQLLTENVMLSLAGGLGGIGIAYAGVRWFASAAPTVLPVIGQITLNTTVLVFAGVVTLATGLVFGLAPAWSATRARLQDALTIRADFGAARMRAHNAVVVAQVALCVVLLVSAGLLTRSLIALTRVDPGFDPQNVLTMQFRLPAAKYDTEDKITAMFASTIAEVRSVPGVRRAALVRATPLNGNGETLPYAVNGKPDDPQQRPVAHRNIVSTDYFETMRIPLIGGRDFSPDDRSTTAPVAIVNEQLAKKIAPQGSALGRQVRLSPSDDTEWRTIVGVVGNAKHFSLNENQLDQLYVPFTQMPLIFTELVVRADGDPSAVAKAVREAIWRVDRDQPVWRIRPLMLSIENQLGGRTFMMRLLASFALLALVLATIGVYGVMSYAVARRTQEMGIRMALGASAREVVGMVLRQGLRTIGIALAIGLAASLGATRLLETQLFGVAAVDPLTFAVAPAILAMIAAVACYLPARRASRVDPLVALRSE